MPSETTRGDRVVVKVMDLDEWERACAAGSYAGSADDIRDGFIHLSTPSQLAGTLDKHFNDRNGLVAIAFLDCELVPDLKWEVSRGGAMFPHYYGQLPTTRACAVAEIARGPDGRFIVPDLEIA